MAEISRVLIHKLETILRFLWIFQYFALAGGFLFLLGGLILSDVSDYFFLFEDD
jgi:hypothetical protein